MDQDHFAGSFVQRSLRLHEHLGIGAGLHQAILQRVGRIVIIARPEIAQDREDVRVGEERLERPHAARASIFAEANERG